MDIKETRRQIDDENAFTELCNTPDMQVEDSNTNTLLIGNRRFAFIEGLKYARAQGHDFSGTEHNEPPKYHEERDEDAEALTAMTLGLGNGTDFGFSDSSGELSPPSTNLSTKPKESNGL